MVCLLLLSTMRRGSATPPLFLSVCTCHYCVKSIIYFQSKCGSSSETMVGGLKKGGVRVENSIKKGQRRFSFHYWPQKLHVLFRVAENVPFVIACYRYWSQGIRTCVSCLIRQHFHARAAFGILVFYFLLLSFVFIQFIVFSLRFFEN